MQLFKLLALASVLFTATATAIPKAHVKDIAKRDANSDHVVSDSTPRAELCLQTEASHFNLFITDFQINLAFQDTGVCDLATPTRPVLDPASFPGHWTTHHGDTEITRVSVVRMRRNDDLTRKMWPHFQDVAVMNIVVDVRHPIFELTPELESFFPDACEGMNWYGQSESAAQCRKMPPRPAGAAVGAALGQYFLSLWLYGSWFWTMNFDLNIMLQGAAHRSLGAAMGAAVELEGRQGAAGWTAVGAAQGAALFSEGRHSGGQEMLGAALYPMICTIFNWALGHLSIFALIPARKARGVMMCGVRYQDVPVSTADFFRPFPKMAKSGLVGHPPQSSFAAWIDGPRECQIIEWIISHY
ncbi:hypothetical protein DFH06DRAFT_1423797 [Mycena polygramma]|nr:hypothetical protein DFH06DRAFT_1423797 [Mycena polygramma]